MNSNNSNSYAKYRYFKLRDSSWQIILDYNITSLPVDVVKLAKQLDIKLVKNSTLTPSRLKPYQYAISVRFNDKWFILYDDKLPTNTVRFTLAHEIGHIVLGHKLVEDKYARTTFSTTRPSDETEADMFAIRLLAPACVIWALDVKSPTELSQLCNISYISAKHRYNRLNTLKNRDKFLTSPLEQQVFNQFKEYISVHKK